MQSKSNKPEREEKKNRKEKRDLVCLKRKHFKNDTNSWIGKQNKPKNVMEMKKKKKTRAFAFWPQLKLCVAVQSPTLCIHSNTTKLFVFCIDLDEICISTEEKRERQMEKKVVEMKRTAIGWDVKKKKKKESQNDNDDEKSGQKRRPSLLPVCLSVSTSFFLHAQAIIRVRCDGA